MKIFTLFWVSWSLLASASAEACSIVNKRETRLGVESGVEGQCANNGWRVACIVTQDEEGISCEGPEGVFQGDQINYLIMTACGCNKRQGLQQQMEEQLEDYP